jgi:hypothetical protein
MKRHVKYLVIFPILFFGTCVQAQPERLSPSPEKADHAKVVRIQCLFGDGFLYTDGKSGVCRYSADLKADDPAGHWILEPVPEVDAIWIRNVKTGEALHIEDQTGWVQTGELRKTFHSYRWRILEKEGFVHLESAWREGRGFSLENQKSDKVGMAGLNDEWWSLRFRLIPVLP